MVEIGFVTVQMKMVFPNALVDLEFYILAKSSFLNFLTSVEKRTVFEKVVH